MRAILAGAENGPKGPRIERGSTLVEFALVLIVLMLMMFGIIDFARALYTYHFVANVAREGTRYAIVRGATCNAALSGCPAEALNSVPPYIQGLGTGIGIDPSLISVTATWPGAPSSATNCSNDQPGCLVRVQVTYPFKFIFPLMPTQTCQIGTGASRITANICMTSISQMVISQ